MSTIRINGRTIQVEGRGSSISIVNGEVRVNGKVVDDLSTHKGGPVEVRWEGPLASLEVGGDLTVSGNVDGNANVGGDAAIAGNVSGNLNAGGDVACNVAQGRITAGGDVTCSR